MTVLIIFSKSSFLMSSPFTRAMMAGSSAGPGLRGAGGGGGAGGVPGPWAPAAGGVAPALAASPAGDLLHAPTETHATTAHSRNFALTNTSFSYRGALPLGLPYTLASGGPWPRAARVAHSLSLVRGPG